MPRDALWTKLPDLRWDDLDRLSSQLGPSYYLADPEIFEGNYRAFLRAFQARYERSGLGYSYKTNYLPRFILRAHELGAYSEVVSWFEFELAVGLGVDGSRIIFNGPVKRADQLSQAFQWGAQVNADSLLELWHIVDFARRSKEQLGVGLRCYVGEDATPGSRFGIDLDSRDGRDVLSALDATTNLTVRGLHCHHSGERHPERFRTRIKRLVEIHDLVLGGRTLEYINVGGGFGSRMSPELSASLGSAAATEDEYAEAICGTMADTYGDSGPTLLLEPGMALLADTMAFVTRVETIKDQGGGKFAVVDGSVFNIKPLRGGINLPIHVIRSPQGQGDPGTWDVVGHTCMEVDVLHHGYKGSIQVGDYIVVENVGAYSNVLNAPFIRGTPPILELVGTSPGAVLRPASTAADLLRSYGVTE